MEEIRNKKDFLEWIQPPSDSLKRKYYFKNTYRVDKEGLILNELILNDFDLTNKNFYGTEFKDCIFNNCEFYYSLFHNCELINCVFNNCKIFFSKFIETDLTNTKFTDCSIGGLDLCDSEIKVSSFIDCHEILDLRIQGNWNRQISFKNCYLVYLDIEPIEKTNSEVITFKECLIKESNFDRIDFSKSKFSNCSLSLNQFMSCILSEDTLSENNETPGQEYNLIDLRTILNSDNLSGSILEEIFGIHNAEIKEYIYGLTSKIELQSIFISYSFEDKEFAYRINNELKNKGIFTFLWEKDSPGGKCLKEIMSSGINEKDRILFIASKNSLKSKACHFELKEGRKKQEKSWETVLFPIHIDNYLFELKKENIRPLEVQKEYWKNIIELRNLNSLDFTKFDSGKQFIKKDYDNLIYRLIKGLRKSK